MVRSGLATQPTAHYRLDDIGGTNLTAHVGLRGKVEGSGHSWSKGQVTNCLSMNGNGWGYVADDPALEGNGGNNITMSFWVNKPAGSQSGAVILETAVGAQTHHPADEGKSNCSAVENLNRKCADNNDLHLKPTARFYQIQPPFLG